MNNTKVKRLITLLGAIALSCVTMAGCLPTGTTGTGDAAAGATGGSMISTILMVVVLGAVMYFFMIRPEKKRKKEAEELKNSLSVGDEITTIGGMTGKIVETTDDSVTFETGEDRVRIEIKKWGISKKTK
jgi:preprotein translocase subunit YajC